jgi:hypothetical protein
MVTYADWRSSRAGFHQRNSFPSKIYAFYQVVNLDGTEEEVRALVHPCSSSEHDDDTLLTERWRLWQDALGRPKLDDVSLDSIDASVYAVEEMPIELGCQVMPVTVEVDAPAEGRHARSRERQDPAAGGVVLLRQRDEWPSLFVGLDLVSRRRGAMTADT